MRTHLLRLASLATCVVLTATSHAQSPSFTLTPGPTLGVVGGTPADVLMTAVPPAVGPMPAPVIGIPAAALGLVAGDSITSISFGNALPAPLAPGMQFYFSVDPPSAGVPVLPPPANVSCESGAGGQAHGDLYLSQPAGPVLPAPNVVSIDGNGLADSPCGLPPMPGLGIFEPFAADDVVALDLCVPPITPAALVAPVFFTLGPASPTLGALGLPPSTVLVVVPPGGGPPLIAAGPPALGLVPGDVIDALDVAVGPGGGFWISLAPGSPSLAFCGITAATVFFAPPPVAACAWPFALPPAAFGLLAGDNIDAISVTADPDFDFAGIFCDNCPGVPNPGQVDADMDGFGDVCDNCPLVANAGQENFDGDANGDACDPCETIVDAGVDTDMDGVDNACDTCLIQANAAIAAAPTANRTLLSHQRDDDADGRGNRCDFDYNQLGVAITATDFNDMKFSLLGLAPLVTANVCGGTALPPPAGEGGSGNTQQCGEFDHDSQGLFVTAIDFNMAKNAFAGGGLINTNFPKCVACTLGTGWSNTIGTGGERLGRPVCQTAVAGRCVFAP